MYDADYNAGYIPISDYYAKILTELEAQTELLTALNENIVIMGGVLNYIYVLAMLVIGLRLAWWVMSGIFFRGA
jgi:hypothetical protein